MENENKLNPYAILMHLAWWLVVGLHIKKLLKPESDIKVTFVGVSEPTPAEPELETKTDM